MFETLETPSVWPFVGRYFAQLIFCYPAAMLVGLPVSLFLSLIGLSGDHPSGVHFAGYQALQCLFVGAFVGWNIALRMGLPFVSSGRWIWLLPAVVQVPIILSEVFRSQHVPWLPEYIFATSDNEGLSVYLGTLPACCAAGYSIGMALFASSRKWAAQDPPTSGWRFFKLALACIVLFFLLSALLSGLEARKFESWKQVSFVIDRPGLWLSKDPNLLCSGPPESGDAFLSNAAAVQSLERRACGDDRPLEPGDAGPPRTWVLEKVRVLTGPNAGLEGWVLAYGLK